MGMAAPREGRGEHLLPARHSDRTAELSRENKGLQSQSNATEGRGRNVQLGHAEEGYTSLKTDH